ncbi:MAG: hypothetical protein WCW35_10210 [Bacteroidota bacterium]
MKYFDERYILYGKLENSSGVLGDCRCEINTNEIDLEAWSATVSVFQGSQVALTKSMTDPNGITFISNGPNEEVRVKGARPSVSYGSYNDEILKFDINELYIKKRHKEGIPDKLSLTYYIPAVLLYEKRNMVSHHYRKGYLNGWQGWKKEIEGVNIQDEWINEQNVIPSPVGTLKISPVFLFKDIDIDGVKTTIIVNQLIIESEIDNPSTSLDAAKIEIEKTIEDYMTTLSLLEADKIDWYYCRGYTSNQGTLEEIQYYKRSIKRMNPAYYAPRYRLHSDTLKKIHIDLTNCLISKSDNERAVINKIIERFIIASRVPAVDTKLIYWHSCLDVLIKECKGEGRSYNHKVIDACIKIGVEWLDIYPEMTITSLEQKAEFPFNRIRNKMIHDGEHPDDYSEVFSELPRIKALCERIITKIIGVDYKNTGFGMVEKF